MIIGGIVLLKVILMGLFSSDYQDMMFIPFVGTFLSGKNPYEHYYANNLIGSFPYFPYMLLIESVAVCLFTQTNPLMPPKNKRSEYGHFQ